MKALFIGGTGTISTEVVKQALREGWDVTLLNRGNRLAPQGARTLIGDIHDEKNVHEMIKDEQFDVVAQFIGYTVNDVERDIRLFQHKVRQYIFISTASAYQKPINTIPITEETPLGNPFWKYSRLKIEAERKLMQTYKKEGFPVTIVRPSHTYNEKKVPVCLHGHKGNWQVLQRILNDKPILIPGDGTSLWTLTHSRDFAKGFVGLMGHKEAIGEAFHITTDECMTWNCIYDIIARALNKPLKVLHVATDFLVEHENIYDFKGTLLGDKIHCGVFDNSKIRKWVPTFECSTSMETGLKEAVHYMLEHQETHMPDFDFDNWCDGIIEKLKL